MSLFESLRPASRAGRACNWHYLLSVINANGSVSPCCGIQHERDDFGSIADKRFREVWTGATYRRVRRLYAGRTDDAAAAPTVCHDCPLPEDQTRAEEYLERYLARAPRSVQKRAQSILEGRRAWRPWRALPWGGRSRYDERRYENLLLALEERAAGVEEPKSYPIGLILDPSSACGLRCPLCPVSYTPSVRQKSLMDPEFFDRVLDELGPYLFFVDFFNWGEPLLNKGLPEMLAKLKKYDIDIRVSSSLSVQVPERTLEAIAAHVDVLTVSIDGMSQESYGTYRRNGDLALALSNLERIADARNRSGTRKPLIDWQYLVFSFNEHEIEDARKLARKLDVQFRPAAPFVDVDKHPEWLSSIDEYVMDRYKPVRAQLDAIADPGSGPPTEIDLRLNAFEGMFGGAFHPWENGGRWLAGEGEVRLRAPDSPGHLFLTAYVPAAVLRGEQLVLSIELDGELLAWLPLQEAGAVTRRVAIDADHARRLAGREVRVTLAASRTFVPRKVDPASADERRLSVIVTGIGLRPERVEDTAALARRA